MKRFVAVLSLAALLCSAVPAAAKPRGCFTKAEQSAEQIVRQGLRLREGAKGCDGPPWETQTQGLWDKIDKQLGPRFLAQTKLRAGAFKREFENDAENRLGQWNGRIVTFFRQYPMSPEYCGTIKKMLEETQKKGWLAVTRQASKAKGQVAMDYKVCTK